MLGAIFIRLLYLIVGSILTLLFLLIAQVSMDDLRLKAGNLRSISDPTVQVGGFYTILPTGEIRGPHCVINNEILNGFYVNSESKIQITNVIGSSLPILSNWTMGLINLVGVGDIMNFAGQEEANSVMSWQGHTLSMSPVKHQRIRSTSSLPEVISESYRLDQNCENTIKQIARTGSCVAMVFQITTFGDQKIGYRLAGDGLCIIPADATDPMFVPSQPNRFMFFLSSTKDWFGLVDQVVTKREK